MHKFIPAALIAIALPATAQASSEQAWNALYRQAAQKCTAVSGLKSVRTSKPLVFSDDNRQVAILVTGQYAKGALRGRSATSLCLYDRRAKVAEVQEATGWRAAR